MLDKKYWTHTTFLLFLLQFLCCFFIICLYVIITKSNTQIIFSKVNNKRPQDLLNDLTTIIDDLLNFNSINTFCVLKTHKHWHSQNASASGNTVLWFFLNFIVWYVLFSFFKFLINFRIKSSITSNENNSNMF